MPWQQYRHYLRQALALPPQVTLRKARWKIKHRLHKDVGRLRSRLLGTQISDVQFQRALHRREGTIQAFLAHRKTSDRPCFFLDSGQHAVVIAALRALAPEAPSRIIAAADTAYDHVFDLLGSGPVSHGQDIDWHVDFKTGHRWNPHQYYADARHAPFPGGYDIKVPWELSRCQHFAWLGQAYWLTGDEKYARSFAAQVLDWIAQNPPQFGVNWTCAMDVAIRAVNWLWGYAFFADSPMLTDVFRLAFFRSLLVHGRHIMQNLERTPTLTSNHYLSDIVGLVYLGLLLPEFKEARRWREFGLQELEKELFKQVYPDGADFEASLSYHRLVTELFLSATILAQLNGHDFSAAYMQRLERMLQFVLYVTKPDGTVPSIGDNDNGRLHRLTVWGEPLQEWRDHRYLLAIGAVLFGRKDFAHAAAEAWEEAVWLFGERAVATQREAVAVNEATSNLRTYAFSDAGIYVMRHEKQYLIVDAGANGQNGNGGHAHNDILSFELYDRGQTWLVDPGTYIYTADFEARNRFRSTAYHNTVMVDRQEQNRFVNQDWLFQLHSDAQPIVHRWESTDEYDLLDASHNGYMRLPEPILHRRQIVFWKAQAPFWVIRDSLLGAGQHTFDLCFHIGDATVSRIESTTIDLVSTIAPAHHLLLISCVNDELTVSSEDAWRSQGYGQKIPSTITRYTITAAAPYEFVTVLWPCSAVDSLEQTERLARATAQSILHKLAGPQLADSAEPPKVSEGML